MNVERMMVALLLMAAGVQTVKAQKMVVTMTDDSKVVYDIVQVKDITFEEAEEHDWVDLGLPSGTLWATCNVGASSPEEYGNYFAWGEIDPKSDYSWSTYKWCNGSYDTLTKYCTDSNYGYNDFTDNKTELEASDDAATANWGSDWQMPSQVQMQELYNSSYTTTEWTTLNGVSGRMITSKGNGNSIFLPAAGTYNGVNLFTTGIFGSYWSRSIGDSVGAYELNVGSNGIYYNVSSGRSYGQSVRPVRVQQ